MSVCSECHRPMHDHAFDCTQYGVKRRKRSREYIGVNEQIVVKNLSVLVHETDEGVVIDIYPNGQEGVDDPIASAYAFFDEVDTEGNE